MLDKTVKRFFLSSIIAVVVVCMLGFLLLTNLMSKATERSVEDISFMYMSEVSMQIQQKFDSITKLRLNQVKGIIQYNQPENVTYGEEMIGSLRLGAVVRNFTYLGLYSEDGEEEHILGDRLTIAHYDEMLDKLKAAGQALGMATNNNEEKYLVLACQAAYPLADGSTSTALIASVSMEYLSDALFLDEENAMVYTHVIDKDGTYVIRSGDEFRDNYFGRLYALAVEKNKMTAENYVAELQRAMDTNQIYAVAMQSSEEGEKHLFCSPIAEDVEWYLISVMPGGLLKDNLRHLDVTRIALVMAVTLAIMFTMNIIFIKYYKLSKQQLRELDLREQEAVRANKAKSEFLSSMSHDIRTPMNAIIGMTEIALRNVSDVVRVEDCLNKVRLSSKHLLGLINDVLDMSKIESGKMTLNISQMSLREVMDDIVNIMQPQLKERNQYFDIYIRDIVTENVYCDAVRLNQVLLNLLSNAVKFTPDQGRIDVHLYQEASPLGEEYIRNHFLVEDNGIGMSEAFQKKIFDTFAREEENEKVQRTVGTGLGTSITKSIVNLMGGTIELHSEQGKGSKFHVTVDLKKAETDEADMRLPEWNVLIVDDNEMLCQSAAANLEALGVHADWTTGGRSAVEMVEEHHNRNDDYRFALIDWKMPDMDGLQTIHKIREKVGCGMPIFLISAYDWNDLEEQLEDAKIEGFISKPLFKSTLYTRLSQYAQGLENHSEDEEQVDLTGKRVLLAEDIEINWEIANEIFSAAGLELDWAENGQICVDKFKQSEVGYYDAVLMDVRMPVLNGYEATEAIRSLDRPDHSLPIIAMTADAFSDDAQHCFECGMDAHLTKPLDIRECMRTLQNYLK